MESSFKNYQNFELLFRMLSESFECGKVYCYEMKEDIVKKICENVPCYDWGLKVWKVSELKAMGVGSVFQHSLRGKCVIEEKADGMKYMRFAHGQAIDLHSDSDPWDKPMRLLIANDAL